MSQEFGQGEFRYTYVEDWAKLPDGMTFDAGTRALGGTPSEAGEFELTYTATDEDGDQASFDLTITVEAAPRTARSSRNSVPGTPTLTRVQYSESTKPALLVSWAIPEMTAGLKRYEVQYRKDGQTSLTTRHHDRSSSFTLSDLNPGDVYYARVRALYEVNHVDSWSDWSAVGSGRANRPPKASSVYGNIVLGWGLAQASSFPCFPSFLWWSWPPLSLCWCVQPCLCKR